MNKNTTHAIHLPISNLTIAEAATITGLTPKTVRQYLYSHKLPYRIKRTIRKVHGQMYLRRKVVIDELELRKWIEKRLT